MNAFKFLHAADLHLDSPFRGLSALPDSILRIIRDSTFQALTAMVDIALEEQVDFVLIAGDVYDAADRSLRAQLRLQRELQRLAEANVAVYIVHGNHDPESGGRADLEWPDRIRFFHSRGVQRFEVCNRKGLPVAEVCGISYAASSVTENLAAGFSPGDNGSLYRIALLHANVDGDSGHDNYSPCSKLQLTRSGFHYWALGHIHTRQVLNELPFIVYPGNTQGRSIKETGAKGCYVVEVSGTGETSLHFHTTDTVRWFREEIVAELINSEQELKDELDNRLERLRDSAEGRSIVVRFVLTGRTPLYAKLSQPAFVIELLGEVREQQELFHTAVGDGFVWLESIDNQTGAAFDLAQLAEQDGFIGDLLRLSDLLLDNEDQLAAFYQRAMEPLLSHPKALRVWQMLDAAERKRLLAAARELAADSLAEHARWNE